MAKPKKSQQSSQKKIRPALTPEARENQLIALAIDLVEQRLIDGTASSQETTHFLKLASSKAKLEKERLELENELTKAKTKSIQQNDRLEALYIDAIDAMRRYGGHGDSDEQKN